MSKAVQLEFGKTMREKFGYLIITSIFMFMSTVLFRIWIVVSGVVDPIYFVTYELFYNILGAGIGFLFAQIFIRMHIKTVRRGLI